MTTERWQRIEGVFQAALECPAECRPGLIEQACGSDPELRAEVESLLAYYGKGAPLLTSAIEREASSLAEKHVESFVGRSVGAYKLTKILGRGGMGVVYLAAREAEDFQQLVAVKLMKRGMDSDETVRRFRAERRILARLDHPNIARLLDGGTTVDGLPYFVMEYVEGAPLLEYCLERKLPIETRLALFRDVCAAVHYAHQHLVVHRDLKPQNILVTESAGGPQVKLLDFGIAKMLSEDSHTTSAMMLTPYYSSPEQFQGKPITTASDIYALGVNLYELLTGKRPCQVEDISPASVALAVCETEPPAPSRHDPRLRGDIDNIVLMALRKEPERRYNSAEQFSEDIRRYLGGLPVLARQDTMVYRTVKLVRRNKIATAAVLFAWIALATGLGVAVWQARRAERGRNEARQFISKVLMASFRDLRMVPGTLAAQRDFANASLVYLNKLAAESGNDASTRFDLATGYFWVAQIQGTIGRMNLGRWEEAMDTDRKALGIAEDLYRRDPANPLHGALLASVRDHIGLCYGMLGYPRENAEWVNRAAPLVAVSSTDAYQKIGTPPLNSHLRDLAKAKRLQDQGHYGAALEEVEKARFSAKYSGSVVVAAINILMQTGDVERARAELRGLLSMPPQQTYIFRTNRAAVRAKVALLEGHPLRINAGKRADAAALLQAAIDEDQEILDKDPINEYLAASIALYRTWLAGVLSDSDPERARQLYQTAAKFYRKSVAQSPKNRRYRMEWARLLAELAQLNHQQGHQRSALTQIDEALRLEREISEPHAFTYLVRGDLALGSGHGADARQAYQEAVNLASAAVEGFPEDMERRRVQADWMERLAAFHEAAGEWLDARDWYAKAVAVWTDWPKFGASTPFNQRRKKQAEAALARAEHARPKL